jgi:sulfur carrier protein ThiS
MVIHVKVLGFLRDYFPDKQMPMTVDVPSGASVSEVFDQLGLPREKPRIILVNADRADLDRVLEDGDTLVAMIPVGGG